MKQGGTAQAHVGAVTAMGRATRRARATTANTPAMKNNWPISPPTLKNSSAMGADRKNKGPNCG